MPFAPHQHASGSARKSRRALVAMSGVAMLLVLSSGSAGAASHGAKSVVVTTEKNATYGTILVSGKTLYTLASNGTPCAATCLKYWPEFVLPKGITKVTAGPGVDAAKLGVVKLRTGGFVVSYAGNRLYYFAGDTASGQANGNISDTWGKWSVVVLKKPTTPVSTTTTSGATSTPTTTTTSPSNGATGF